MPAPIISQLGLKQVGERDVETSTGITKSRIFADAQIIVEGREGRFDCLELPEGVAAVLLGVTSHGRTRIRTRFEKSTVASIADE